MTNSSLDNVNELLRLEYGDKGRLEDIKRRLGNGQILYNSDNNYLEQLLNQHEGEIHKKTVRHISNQLQKLYYQKNQVKRKR
jgi:hypothetical protein